MTMEPLQFFTPVVGRLTHGSTTEMRTKDQDGRLIEPEKQRFEIGVAFDKQQIWPFLTESFYPYLASALARDPNAMQRMTHWFSTLDGFSMKVTDGDKPNAKGQVNENTKGHFVFWFNAIELKCVAGQSADALIEIDPATIKRGYYVQVAGNIKPNEQPGDRAGIYLNANVVWLRAEGAVIASGIDPTQAFAGAAPAALPSGLQAYDPSRGAGAAFSPPTGLPGVTGAPATAPMAPVGLPGVGGAPVTAPAPTASYGEPQTTPHPGFMSGPPR